MIRAGLRLGGLAFLVGMALGPIRELLLAPRIGGLAAAWAEGVVMGLALWWLARRGVPPGLAPGVRLGLGVVAVATGLLAEAALGLALQASGLAAGRVERGIAETLPGLLLLLWLGVLPLLVRRP